MTAKLVMHFSEEQLQAKAQREEEQFQRDKAKHGAIRAVLNREKSRGNSAGKLTVLSPQIDPFRLDTPAHHRNAKWFAEQIERFIGDGTVHLRGLHYKCNGNVHLPSGGISQGMPYINSDDCWQFILSAAKAARWLKYVPPERIFDNRNDPPVIYVPEEESAEVFLSKGLSVESDFPDRERVVPHFACIVEGRQPYRIVFFGEKSSLAEVLKPIAEYIGAEMVLCTGESSDTRIMEIAARAHDDGRPLVILYFSDFDPSGWQMSISVSRKIQACQHLLYEDLQAEVHHVALTLDQVEQFSLPETPLKEDEKRADNWKKHWGHEQTEIDALLALHPEALREITLQAIKPFFDHTLSDRSSDAWGEWADEAETVLQEHPEYNEHQAEILEAYHSLKEASENLVKAQERAVRALEDVEPPEPIVPEPEITARAPEPIFTTNDDYETASRKLINRKRLL